MVRLHRVLTSLVFEIRLKAQIKRKPTTSVANYDIELLAAWYEAIREMRGMEFALYFHSHFTDVGGFKTGIQILCHN
jgi:hypothetical protein